MRGRTYRYFTGEPLYPFGYGLSYTTFAFNHLRFDKDLLGANDDLVASVEVTNTGRTAGDVIVQLYLSRPGVDGAPIRSLVGMQRSELESGRKQIRVDSDSESQPEHGQIRRDQEDCSWRVADLGRRRSACRPCGLSQGRGSYWIDYHPGQCGSSEVKAYPLDICLAMRARGSSDFHTGCRTNRRPSSRTPARIASELWRKATQGKKASARRLKAASRGA